MSNAKPSRWRSKVCEASIARFAFGRWRRGEALGEIPLIENREEPVTYRREWRDIAEFAFQRCWQALPVTLTEVRPCRGGIDAGMTRWVPWEGEGCGDAKNGGVARDACDTFANKHKRENHQELLRPGHAECRRPARRRWKRAPGRREPSRLSCNPQE